MVVAVGQFSCLVVYEHQGQWWIPVSSSLHIEVSLHKTQKPCSSTDIYLAAVQQKFNQGDQ